MPELVITGSLVIIAENLVSFSCLLELFLSIPVTRILVRMIFQGLFAVGLLDLILCGTLADAKYFVIVSF